MTQNYLLYYIVSDTMKAMSYKKFRESSATHYDTIEGKMERAEIIKKLELFLVQKLGEGQDFFDQYKVREL
ncbi:MAG TPA: hypothetical protein VFA69_01930 [Candidatus Nitrosotalea sp.]|nr:hypothetical protein [Candidatus Nitrosotalea sp.]